MLSKSLRTILYLQCWDVGHGGNPNTGKRSYVKGHAMT